MRKIWVVDWLYKYPDTLVFDTAAEAYNWIFDRISEYLDFDELRKELASSFDISEEEFGIEEIVDVYTQYIR